MAFRAHQRRQFAIVPTGFYTTLRMVEPERAKRPPLGDRLHIPPAGPGSETVEAQVVLASMESEVNRWVLLRWLALALAGLGLSYGALLAMGN